MHFLADDFETTNRPPHVEPILPAFAVLLVALLVILAMWLVVG
ncbi:MAG TPA: hypothetical protein VLB47_03115 [Solirubrobacteraceae bacterium]|nr:hypothetical protein [Solirubrobacteraceae bacterium]